MIPQPPPGQGPIDPRGAFAPPPPPPGGGFQHQQFQAPPGMPPMPPQMGLGGPGGPMMMPPMFYPPPPPPRRGGGGFARGIFVTFATVIFGASLTLNLYLLTLTGLAGSGGSQSTNVLTGDPKQKIAHVPIKGIIMDEAYDRFDRMMKSIEADGDVKAIVLEIDSPGGSVTASDQIHNRLTKYKADHPSVPVVVSMAGLAASGGYYVACPADYIFAQPTTLTGNIGVLMPQYNVAELFDKWGIKETTIESTGTPFKNAGSMFRTEKPEDRAYIQDIADKAFAQFKDVVAKGRQSKLKKPLGDIANGKIYMAADAEALGLIDKVGYLRDAYDHAASQAKLTKRTIVKYHDPPTFLDSLMSGKSNVTGSTGATGGAGGAGSAGQAININGIQVNAGDLRELLTPRLMYLWRGQ